MNQVFISFKNSYNNEETIDRTIAKQVYDKLTARNIEVFMSNVTLLELGEGAYRKAIDNALDQAMVMVVVSTYQEKIVTNDRIIHLLMNRRFERCCCTVLTDNVYARH